MERIHMLRVAAIPALMVCGSATIVFATEHRSEQNGQAIRNQDRKEPPAPVVYQGNELDIVVVGRRAKDASSAPSIPPRCVKRSGDLADLVQVGRTKSAQRVIAPDKSGVLRWQLDKEPVLGPAFWQRAGTGIGQYVFRLPDDGLPMCIGSILKRPNGWGQLRKIIPTTKEMRGKYVHFTTLIAARDADQIRFWVALGGNGGRVMGGDTHEAPLHGTFGWLQADVIVGPVPLGANHISYGFLLWGKGDVWVLDPQLEFKTRDEVRKIPTLPVTLETPPGEHGL
jgi:hypothetical protein